MTAGKLAAGAVDSARIADGSITAGDLQADSVRGAAIADGEVGTTELANGAVTGAKVQNGTLGVADFAASDGGGGALVGSVPVSVTTWAPGCTPITATGISGVQVGDRVILTPTRRSTPGLIVQPLLQPTAGCAHVPRLQHQRREPADDDGHAVHRLRGGAVSRALRPPVVAIAGALVVAAVLLVALGGDAATATTRRRSPPATARTRSPRRAGWKAVADGPAATVLQRRDKRGVVVIRRRAAVAGDLLDAVAARLERSLRRRLADFRPAGARVATVGGARAPRLHLREAARRQGAEHRRRPGRQPVLHARPRRGRRRARRRARVGQAW